MHRVSLPVRTPNPSAWAVFGWTLFLGAQAATLVTYLWVTGVSPAPFHVYPFVWITVGVAAIRWTPIPSTTRRRALVAAGIATAYFLALGVAGGVFGVFLGDHAVTGLRIAGSVPPGYGPAVFYVGDLLYLSLSPYTLVGYAALAYLVYVTIVDAQRAAVSGLLGLLTCVSCTWPIFASVLSGAAGSATVLASVYAQSYELSTAAFLATVALLYWRPIE